MNTISSCIGCNIPEPLFLKLRCWVLKNDPAYVDDGVLPARRGSTLLAKPKLHANELHHVDAIGISLLGQISVIRSSSLSEDTKIRRLKPPGIFFSRPGVFTQEIWEQHGITISPPIFGCMV